MKIFDKRPLCLILCILLGGFVFFTELPNELKLILPIGAALALIYCLYLRFKKENFKPIVLICSVALLLSTLLSFLYFSCYFNVYEMYSGEVEVVGRISEIKEKQTGYSVAIECESIDGKGASNKLYSFISYDICPELEENERINIKGCLSDFESTSDFDTRSYYRANGYSARLNDVKECYRINKTDQTLEGRIRNYRLSICNALVDGVGEVGGGLLSALLFGERDFLSDGLKSDFTRVGLTHTLALSGLHLSILTFFIARLLSLIGMSKKPRKVIEIAFVIVYTAFTGFPVSVVRAAIMLILCSSLFLLSERSDSITTLSVAATVICVVTPYAIYDLSFWLSVFATLGVVIYVELKKQKRSTEKEARIPIKILKGFLSGIAISLFAIGATMLATVTSFGTISVLAPIATPIFSVLLEIFMYIGLVFTVTFGIPFVGALLDLFAKLLANAISAISSLNGIYLKADYLFVRIIAFAFTLLVIAFLVLEIKKKKKYLMLLLSVIILIFSSAIIANIAVHSGEDIEYACCDNSEHLMLKADGKLTYINLSDTTATDIYDSISYISDYGTYEIERYILTSYPKSYEDATAVLASTLKINNLYLPSPSCEEEYEIFLKIKDTLKSSSCSTVTYKMGYSLNFDGYTFIPIYRNAFYENTKFAFILRDGNSTVTYLSSGMLEDKTKTVALSLIEGCDTLIFGRHGDSYKDYTFDVRIPGIKRIIVSSKRLELSEFYTNPEVIYSPSKLSIKR